MRSRQTTGFYESQHENIVTQTDEYSGGGGLQIFQEGDQYYYP
jgi:hypothetical protein